MGQVGNFVSVASAIVTLVLRLKETGVAFSNSKLFCGILAAGMEGEFILRFDPELQDIIQVA